MRLGPVRPLGAIAIALALTALFGVALQPGVSQADDTDATPESDREALLAFYEALDGENWRRKWDLEAPVDDWFGVNVGDDGLVQELVLSANELRGELPPESGDLANLQTLHLNSNELTGPIPAELGNLTHLQELHISRNMLSGAIPPELGNLAELRRLQLNDNQLTGPMPSWLGGLVNLEWLHLNDNMLTGPIPDLSPLTALKRLIIGPQPL